MRGRIGYQGQTLQYIRAAAEASCLTARGVLTQISRACTPDIDQSSTIGMGEQRNWLFDAAASGSLIALWELRRTSQSLEGQAWQVFRSRGGYIGSESPMGISSRPMGVQSRVAILGLQNAATYGTADNIYRLTDSYDVDEVDEEGQTALYKAAAAGNFDTLKALIDLGADASITTAVAHISCLHWLFMFEPGSTEAVIQMLLSRSARMSARTVIARRGLSWQHILFEHFPFHWPIGSPFHWACFTRSFPAMEALLRAGVDVDELDSEVDDQAQTPLGMAMFRGDAEVVKFLLAHGASPSRADGEGRTPLHMLALSDAQHRLFRLPKCLYWWCYHGGQEMHVETVSKCVDLIVNAGADINSRRGRNHDGNTPLLDATRYSKDGGVTLALLKAGADASICDTLQTLPIHFWASLDGRRLAYPGTWEPALRLLITCASQYHKVDHRGDGVFHHTLYNPSIGHFRRGMELLLVSPLRTFISHKNNRDESLLRSALSVRQTGGVDAELRFETLLEHGAAASLGEKEIGYLMWIVCRNRTLTDSICLRIVKRLLGMVKERRHNHLITKLYKKEPIARWDKKGSNILMATASNAHLETFKFLLRPDIDLQILSPDSWSVLDFALNEAERLRSIGLERWTSHGPQNEPPRHRGDSKSRDPNIYKELFWYSPRLEGLENGEF